MNQQLKKIIELYILSLNYKFQVKTTITKKNNEI